MATTNLRRAWPAALALALACATFFSGCGPAQMGPDPEAFKSIDALYTAVSLRDPALVDRSAASLATLRDAGKLPGPAHDALAAMIAEAKGGDWEPAQSRLREFMLGQRK